ncbi:hypothetical protein COCNU_scaffold001144G000040 [Cocos nucifera]|nr:hypothetical protein [Cocos nucifera]
MTPEELSCLTKGIKALKRKDGPIGESSRTAYVEETSSTMSTQVAPDLETTAAALSLTLPDETAIPAPLEKGKVVKKKKKKKKKKKNARVGALLVCPLTSSKSLPS